MYSTSKCGGCGKYWEYMNSSSNMTKLGPPIIKCSSCGSMNRTKFKLFREMTVFEKIILLGGQLFVACFSLGMVVVGLCILYDYFLNNGDWRMGSAFNEWYGVLIVVFLMLFGSGGVLGSLPNKIRRVINNLESSFDLNGGYISSEEYYTNMNDFSI